MTRYRLTVDGKPVRARVMPVSVATGKRLRRAPLDPERVKAALA